MSRIEVNAPSSQQYPDNLCATVNVRQTYCHRVQGPVCRGHLRVEERPAKIQDSALDVSLIDRGWKFIEQEVFTVGIVDYEGSERTMGKRGPW